MKKIVYLHGLESKNMGPKNDWLRTMFSVYDPKINYYEAGIYSSLKKVISDFAPHYIVGSSMGGYFAYLLSRELNIKAVLFNPAIQGRSCNPDINGFHKFLYRPDTKVVLGKNDLVINSSLTITELKNEGYENFVILEHAHRSPFEVFKNEIMSFI